MKANKFTTLLFAALTAGMFTGCVNDDDTSLPAYTPVVFGEDFDANAVDGEDLNVPGWRNYAQEGTVLWTSQYYSLNNYAEFSGYQSGEASNIGWLISPSINLGQHANEKLVFLASQSYVTSAANSLEVLISTNYDGTNVEAATWEPLTANLPTTASPYFEFVESGEISLAQYSGNVNIAFRVKGGNGGTIDGGYQVDSVRITY